MNNSASNNNISNSINNNTIYTTEGHTVDLTDPEIQRINDIEEMKYERDGVTPAVITRTEQDIKKLEGKYGTKAIQHQDSGEKMKQLSFRLFKKRQHLRFMRTARDARMGQQEALRQAQARVNELDAQRAIARRNVSSLSGARSAIRYSGGVYNVAVDYPSELDQDYSYVAPHLRAPPSQSPVEPPPNSRIGRTPPSTPVRTRSPSPPPRADSTDELDNELENRLNLLQIRLSEAQQGLVEEKQREEKLPPVLPKTNVQVKPEVKQEMEVPIKLHIDRDEKGIAQCPICYHNLNPASTTVLNCGHVFHFYCAERAWQDSGKCGICRRRTRFIRRPSASSRVFKEKFDDIFLRADSPNSP